MKNETDLSHASTEDKWDKSNNSDTYVRLLLLFGPPPEGFFNFKDNKNFIVLGNWQDEVKAWLFAEGIITEPLDGSWLREFLRWHREKCNE